MGRWQTRCERDRCDIQLSSVSEYFKFKLKVEAKCASRGGGGGVRPPVFIMLIKF